MKIGIIGCGIVGAYLAWKLAKEHEVFVFEERKRIGGKPCSGLISERLWNFIPKNKRLLKHKIRYCNINFPKKTTTLYFNPKMMVIDRSGLDRHVTRLAQKEGAKIYKGYKAKRMFFHGRKRPQISFENKKRTKVFEFDRIIGADGALSFVRKEVGAKEPEFRLGIYTYKRQRNKRNVVETFPLRNGFSWKIPRKDNIEVGAIENKKKTSKEFEKVRRKFKIAKKSRKHSALIPMGVVTTNSKTVALCGDAAGLTKPWSGGGVIWGLTAADILVSSFPNFKAYNKKIKKRFVSQVMIGRLMNKAVIFTGKMLPWFLPHEIRFDSDFM